MIYHCFMLEKADLILFLFVAAIMPNHDLLNLNLNFSEAGYMFIGREAELKFLEDRYETDDGQLIVLYGRRRVGKTETLKLNDQPKISYWRYIEDKCVSEKFN